MSDSQTESTFRDTERLLRKKVRRYEKELEQIAYDLCEGEWHDIAVHYEEVARKVLEKTQ